MARKRWHGECINEMAASRLALAAAAKSLLQRFHNALASRQQKKALAPAYGISSGSIISALIIISSNARNGGIVMAAAESVMRIYEKRQCRKWRNESENEMKINNEINRKSMKKRIWLRRKSIMNREMAKANGMKWQ